MAKQEDEDELLRSVALQNARSILLARRHAEEDLHRQSEWLKVTLNSIGDAVITTDGEGRITSMNQMAMSLTGWTQGDAAGKPLPDVFRIINEETRQPVETPLKRVLASGRIIGLANHTVLVAKGGAEHPIDDSAAPIRDSDGKILGLVLIFRDITERREIERRRVESEERFRSLVVATSQVVWTTDPDGQVVNDSPSWRAFTGQTQEQRRGWGWLDAIHPDDRKRTAQVWRHRVADRSICQTEYRLRTADGSYRWTAVRAVPVLNRDGSIREWVGTNADITERKQAEIDRQRFVSLAENSSDFIGMCGMDFMPFYVNRAGIKVVGLDGGEQFLHTPVREFFFPDDRDRVMNDFFPSVLEKGSGQIEVRFRHFKTGEAIWMLYNVWVVTDVQGTAVGLATVSRNITDRKQAEEALRQTEAQFRQLADAMPQIVWAARPDGYIDYYNERWYEYTGFPRGEFGQSSWEPILHPDDVKPCVDTYFGCIKAEKPYQIEYRFKDRRTGGYRWFMGRALPIKNAQNQIVRWFGTCTDIDDVKQAQEALQEADRRKDEFLGMLAHELRSPLAAIANAAQVLDRVGSPDASSAKLRSIIHRQSLNLTRMVDDLLDVSRIARGKIRLNKEVVDLSTIIGRAVEVTRPFVESRQHQLTVSLGSRSMRVEADPTRLEQILVNLLNNAAKYTDPGGRIRLLADRVDGQIVIRVLDNGVGITQDMLPRVFDLFTQADTSLDRSKGGLGIGLAMVRNLIQLHGGIVTVHSDGTGRGSEFVVRLPAFLHDDREPAACPATLANSAVPPLRVLIVDDRVDTADCICMLVQSLGHDASMVHNGADALEAAHRDRPDLMLVDIGMPNMNGYELARRLRADSSLAGLVLIALTGYGRDDDRRSAATAGFDRHLVKPVDFETLEAVLADAAARPRNGENGNSKVVAK